MDNEAREQLNDEQIVDYIQEIPDEVLERFQFSSPWQYDSGIDSHRDPDGFTTYFPTNKEDSKVTRDALQIECWNKFHKNPQINTSTRGLVGRLTGLGFACTSEIFDIQEAIEEIEEDPRNRLYNYWPKFIGRNHIEGELFLSLTVHTDGFIEVDFIDPGVINKGGDEDSGILFHPNKPNMPLFYNISDKKGSLVSQIPSIYIARYPELLNVAKKHKDYNRTFQQKSRTRKHFYKPLKGYYRFIVSWDKGYMTKRAVSYMRTTLEWLNYYENLKKYEIDHKKSAGAYLWIFRITEARAFKQWLSLSDEDRRKTGIMQKKTPGASLVLPPGVEVDVKNPQLSSIREQDSDILQMVASGLDEPEDVLMGTNKGTYASTKANRGPMSDRTSNEVAYFSRFMIHDFWGSVFFLKSSVGTFPKYIEVNEAVSFDDNQEPIFKKVKRRPEKLIDMSFPVSETINFEGRAKALLGVKHGPISETLGIPNAEVSKRLGIGGYGKMRLLKATEEKKYKKLVYEMGLDAESVQEKAEGEPGKGEK